jgi:hypothetical protein
MRDKKQREQCVGLCVVIVVKKAQSETKSKKKKKSEKTPFVKELLG